MGVYIPKMEMPTCCYECPLICEFDLSRGTRGGEKSEHCPLIEVKPHGRLIDADALIDSVSAETCDCNPDHFDLEDKEGYGKWMLHNGINTGITAARVRIKNAPTIIEAEDE